jgi:hypothetical protein
MNLKGIVTIKFIDRKTNKIVKKITSNNTMLINGAYCLMYGLTGIQTPTPITKMVLFDDTKSYIKYLDVNITPYNTPGCLFTAIDNSSDIYTVYYLALSPANIDYTLLENSYFACYLGGGYDKDYSYKIKIEWEVWIYYSEPP